jgi:hypothetical protein
MDRIIKITTSILIVILVVFVSLAGYDAYIGNAYRSSLSGTFTYSCTISTTSSLTNVTLFMPVPADHTGTSLIIAQLSAHEIAGIPDSWKTELYDTGKSTLLRITTSSIVPPEGTDPGKPYTITFATNATSKGVIDTKHPVLNSPMFRPVQAVESTSCTGNGSAGAEGRCYTYTTALYADYMTGPGTVVTISSSLSGKNAWQIFEPSENSYHTEIHAEMTGNQKGWTAMSGHLTEGIGSYDQPALLP